MDGGNFSGEDDGDDDEVFALKGLESDGDDEGDDAIETDEYDDEEPVEDVRMQGKKPKKSKKTKLDSEASSSEEEETWGKAKSAYYSSNAAQLESDDEEGNELEEQEAKRLQGKMREDMAEGDFGLDDMPDLDGKEEIGLVWFLRLTFLANLSPKRSCEICIRCYGPFASRQNIDCTPFRKDQPRNFSFGQRLARRCRRASGECGLS